MIPTSSPKTAIKFEAKDLTAGYEDRLALKDMSLQIKEGGVTALIGPSGCGKSTFVRCLNRMHELDPSNFIKGAVYLDGEDIYGGAISPKKLRQRVVMVFSDPAPFPHLSIAKNIMSGYSLTGRKPTKSKDEIIENSLKKVHLWRRVKDRLNQSALNLSLADQQKLCLARALAVEPEVLLLDQPCLQLDPTATSQIDDVIHGLRGALTTVIVTHSLTEAGRVSDYTAFLYQGAVVEYAKTGTLFTSPTQQRTEDYLTGKIR